jgi:hypothetical protein
VVYTYCVSRRVSLIQLFFFSYFFAVGCVPHNRSTLVL